MPPQSPVVGVDVGAADAPDALTGGTAGSEGPAGARSIASEDTAQHEAQPCAPWASLYSSSSGTFSSRTCWTSGCTW